MEKKYISFTKLGTVKGDVFEYTYADFYQLMYGLISRNTDKNSVQYNKKEDCYEVIYDSTIYVVKVGKDVLRKTSQSKDIIEMLNKLITLTKQQKELFGAEELEKQEEKAKTETAIKNGEKGIFNSDEDRKIYIDYLKKKLYSISDILKNMFEGLSKQEFKKEFDKLNEKDVSTIVGMVTQFVSIVASIVLILISSFIGVFNLALFLISLINIASLGIISGLLAIGIVYGGYELSKIIKIAFKNISKKAFSNRKIKKQIKALEKSLIITSSDSIIQSDTNNKESIIKDQSEGKEKKTTNNVHGSIKELAKEFKALKEKILVITDEKKKELFSRELLKIIDSFKEKSKTMEEQGDYLIIYRNILNQIVSLTYRVEEEKKVESKKQETDDEFKAMLDEVDKITSGSMSRK